MCCSFFQAEDGIRDATVTGVQTCALPILARRTVSVAPYMKWRNRPYVGLRWLLFKTGPGATNHFDGGAFVRSNSEVTHPNVMLHFLPIAVRYDGSAPAGGHGCPVPI